MSVPDDLIKLADLHRDRHGQYGGTEVTAGELFSLLFPEGLQLVTRLEFSRAALFFHMADKLLRYANNFKRGGHQDSLRDIAVYAMMLRGMDESPPDRLRDNRPGAQQDSAGRTPPAHSGVPWFSDAAPRDGAD